MWVLIAGLAAMLIASVVVRAIGGAKGQKKFEKITKYISLAGVIILGAMVLFLGPCDLWEIATQ